MPDPLIANAYLDDGGNCFRAIPSSPGRRVEFRANHAPVRDPRDLIACLRHPSVLTVIERDSVDWIAQWMNECGTAQPPIGMPTLPAGFEVVGKPGDYSLVRPPEPEEEAKAEKEPWLGVPTHPEGCECKMCARLITQRRRVWKAPSEE